MVLLLSMIILGPPLFLLIGHVVSEVWDSAIRHPTDPGAIPELDPFQLGCLERGGEGVVETALASLVQREVLIVDIEQRLLRPSNQPTTGLSKLEKQVMIGIRQGSNLRKLYHRQ
jgi:uncharacterized protein (TIGR04222 family)